MVPALRSPKQGKDGEPSKVRRSTAGHARRKTSGEARPLRRDATFFYVVACVACCGFSLFRFSGGIEAPLLRLGPRSVAPRPVRDDWTLRQSRGALQILHARTSPMIQTVRQLSRLTSLSNRFSAPTSTLSIRDGSLHLALPLRRASINANRMKFAEIQTKRSSPGRIKKIPGIYFGAAGKFSACPKRKTPLVRAAFTVAQESALRFSSSP